jgi:1-Cys peroxiredoxin 6
LQLTAKNNDKIATPVDWKNGDAVMIHPSVKADEAAKLFPNGYQTIQVPSQKEYLRLTAQPSN